MRGIRQGELMVSQLGVARLLKLRGPLVLSDLARELGVTYEAVRQVVEKMESKGFLERARRPNSSGRGRPAWSWTLTVRGEHLFPKKYDELSDALLTAVGTASPLNGHYSLLKELADVKTAALTGGASGRSFDDRLEALRNIYGEDDAYLTITKSDAGTTITEHNCPFLNVALAHPALCSVTTNVMGRVLERQVERIETFQGGDGRCVFRVLEQKPEAQFVLEG